MEMEKNAPNLPGAAGQTPEKGEGGGATPKSPIMIDMAKVRRIRKIILRNLEKKNLYPMVHSLIDGSYVEIECVSSYHDGSRKWFSNHPKSEKDWELMENYAIFNHVEECPFLDECPTVRKAIEKYKILKEAE
ncbi:MAG: hypothetical protein QW491_09530 [Thermoproteota archaeon]